MYAEEFAKSSLFSLFGTDKIKEADRFSADYFSNSVLVNNGNMNFEVKPLPFQSQLTAYRDASIVNANNDNLPDILLVGNYYENNIELGRFDADFGTTLINKGAGNFECQPLNGLTIKGQVRHIRPIQVNKQKAFVLARNNDSVIVIKYK